MHHYEIRVEWPHKADNILHDKRRSPISRRGLHRQHENVVAKYIDMFRGTDYSRLTVTQTHCS